MSVRSTLVQLLSPRLRGFDLKGPAGLLAIDLGCGASKREGTLGLDCEPLEGVDHVVDFERDRLPFEDATVGSIFSSHSIEHLDSPTHLFRELSRVAAHGARFELWTPYVWHNTAFLPDHRTHWTHEYYRQVGIERWDLWRERLGARWHIDEFVYIVAPDTQKELRRHGYSPRFAVDHLHNVVAEFGVRGWIDKSGSDTPSEPARRCYAASRPESRVACHPLDGGPMASLPALVRRRVVSLARSLAEAERPR